MLARPWEWLRVVLAVLAVSESVHAENWPQFRGPGSRGVSSESGVPVEWSATSNVAWKTALAGPGHSSPIVWGDRIFLTAFRPDTGVISSLYNSVMGMLAQGVAVSGQLVVVCLDRVSGNVLWERAVTDGSLESVHPTNSPASPTPVTDGKYV